ncbi:MAG: hypothetical protein VXZ27_13755, partial [SAR324 cluster bacterium]|nr:hypothetical protein [SAR324 cluster bacterium]
LQSHQQMSCLNHLPPQLKSTATSRVEQFPMAAASSLTNHQMLLLASFVPHKLASATTAY